MSTDANTQGDMMDRELRPDAGVTLVEMMVVIVIIGLITAIVAIIVLPSQDKARVEKAKADIAAIDQRILDAVAGVAPGAWALVRGPRSVAS